jgi:hypothetical protein
MFSRTAGCWGNAGVVQVKSVTATIKNRWGNTPLLYLKYTLPE